MPLKKPLSIPKLPKTRKKSIDALKKAIPLKKKKESEFIAKLYFKFDMLSRKQYYAVLVYTVKEFSYLNYEIAVETQQDGNEIDVSILGLSMKHSYLVEPKPAYKELLFEDLYGKHTLTFIKQDGSMNNVDVDFNIFKKEITILKDYIPEKKNNSRFINFQVDEESYSFERKEDN